MSEAAEIAAELIGGRAGRFRLDLPVTAHILGGVVIGNSPERVSSIRTIASSAIPGSTLSTARRSAGISARPALTIAVQAERAMSFWPPCGEPDERPPS